MTRFDSTLAAPDDANSLEALGISSTEEAVYRALLRAPGSTIEALARELRTTPAAVAGVAESLERKGFATHAPEETPRLFPTPPDLAVEALLLRRQKQLLAVRQAVEGLQREQGDNIGRHPLVEIISADPAAQLQPYASSHSCAQTEVLCLVRPPFLVSAPNRDEETRAEARRRGVRYRNIVHPDTLNLPGWVEMLQKDIEAGEEVRMLADFPFKMIVADRDLALLPLKIDEPHGAMLLLRRSAVLDALCELFETLWLRAVPVRFDTEGQPVLGGSAAYPAQLRSLVPLLASGANDKAVAERLGVSERTLVRRIDLLYQELNARSRFQAGWLAALRGASGRDEG